MKLAIVTASFALALATITGCAVSAEDPQEPSGQEQAKETDPVDDGPPKQDSQVPKVDDSHVAPQMKCQWWEYVDGRRICVR